MMFDTLNNLQNQNAQLGKQVMVGQGVGESVEDQELGKAIMMSYQENNQGNDFSSPVERQRQAGLPVGLKNVGNTCYFNSLLQMYFLNHQFVKEVLQYKRPVVKQENKRKEASVELVVQLQRLFTFMVLSNKKYVDPLPVLKSMVDEEGHIMHIGDQKDVAEFNLYFLARVDEGLQLDSQRTTSLN